MDTLLTYPQWPLSFLCSVWTQNNVSEVRSGEEATTILRGRHGRQQREGGKTEWTRGCSYGSNTFGFQPDSPGHTEYGRNVSHCSAPLRGCTVRQLRSQPAQWHEGVWDLILKTPQVVFQRTHSYLPLLSFFRRQKLRQRLQIQTSGLSQVFCINCSTVQTQSTWYVWMFHFVFSKMF